MSQQSRFEAEIISIEQGRAARSRADETAEVGGPGGPAEDLSGTEAPRAGARPRCSAATATGRRCRNYAVDGHYCQVHVAQLDRARSDTDGGPPGGSATATDPAGTDPAGTDPAGSDPAGSDPADEPSRRRAGPREPTSGAAGDHDAGAGLEELARFVARQGWAAAVDGIDALRDVAGEEWVEHLRVASEFMQRRLTGDYVIDEFGFDEHLTANLLMPLLRPLHRHYWRVTSHGAHHLPQTGGGLVVANHAGTLPADALITRFDILDQTGRHSRELGAELVFRLPVIGELARKTGATLATNDDADRLLEAGEMVAVWPEGFKGIGKGYRNRYKLQRFGRGGFVATALRAQVPIVPTAIVGSEEIYPMVYDLRLLARLLGLPYFPVVAQMFALPVLGPLALLPLPSKWIIEYGQPIDTTAYRPETADDPMAVFDLTDQVRETIQDMLARNLLGRRSIFL